MNRIGMAAQRGGLDKGGEIDVRGWESDPAGGDRGHRWEVAGGDDAAQILGSVLSSKSSSAPLTTPTEVHICPSSSFLPQPLALH